VISCIELNCIIFLFSLKTLLGCHDGSLLNSPHVVAVGNICSHSSEPKAFQSSLVVKDIIKLKRLELRNTVCQHSGPNSVVHRDVFPATYRVVTTGYWVKLHTTGPSLEAHSGLADQEIIRIVWHPKYRYRF
jgi:hypothetical protein